MILKNQSPYDFYWDLEAGPASIATNFVASYQMMYTYGEPYYHGINPSLWTGWKLDVVLRAEGSHGVATYGIYFENPWDSVGLGLTGVGLHLWYFRVYMRNARLSGGCSRATLAFDKIELERRDTEFGIGTVIYHVDGPFTKTFDYNPIYNRDFVEPAMSGLTVTPGPASCSTSIATLPSYSVSGIADAGFAFKYSPVGFGTTGWTEYNVDFINQGIGSGTACGCGVSVRHVSFSTALPNSEWIYCSASYEEQVNSTYWGSQHFTCASTGGSYDTLWYYISRRVETHAINFYSAEMSSPMNQHQLSEIEVCDTDGIVTTSWNSIGFADSHCMGMVNTRDFIGIYSSRCDFYSGPLPLPPCIFPDTYVTSDPEPPLVPYCSIGISQTSAWTGVATCGGYVASASSEDRLSAHGKSVEDVITWTVYDESLKVLRSNMLPGSEFDLESSNNDFLIAYVAVDHDEITIQNERNTMSLNISATNPSSPVLATFKDGGGCVFWIESDTVKMARIDANLNLLTSPANTNLSSVREISGCYVKTINGQPAVQLAIIELDYDYVVKQSTDFINFS